MKMLLAMLIFGCLAATPYAWAQDDPHAGHHPPAAAKAADNGDDDEDDDDDDDEAAQAEGQDQAADGEHDHGKAGGRLQENMKRMQALMARMQETTDPAQRRALLGEHLQAMRAQVKLMLAQAGGHAQGGEAAAQGGHEDHAAQPAQAAGAGDKKAGADKKKCAMMEGGKCKMMGGEKKGGMMGGGMMKMHKQMEQRVQMMEQLLEQMVEREAVEHELESR